MTWYVAKGIAKEDQQPAIICKVVTEVNLLAVHELADHDNIINS